MNYQVHFGHIAARPRAASPKNSVFRLALLGDFSAGAQRGRIETGAALASRKPLRVDCDNLDAVIRRLKIKLALPLGPDGSAMELAVRSMDDFHPEQLYENLEIFAEGAALRQRLERTSTFAKAAAEVQSWASETPPPAGIAPARGSVIPVDAKLSDFSRLVDRATTPAAPSGSVDELLRHLLAPYIVPAADPDQEELIAAVDEGLAGAMRSVLHHPDFQVLEALWRSVDFLVRRLETDQSLQIVLYDISAEELAADLSEVEALEDSGLYRLLVEQPASDVNEGPLTVIAGLYTFERTPPHFELLGRLARVVAQAPAAFISALDAGCLKDDPKDLHLLIKSAWAALRALPEAGYLGLVSPRFLLRLPYGERTEPVDCFAFEEFTPKTGLRGMLWGNPAILAGLLLGQTFARDGMAMKLGSILSVGEMPFYYYTDQDGDQVALPCTERLMTSRLSSLLSTQGLIPLVCIKGAPEVRLGGFGSIAGAELGGPWAPIAVPPPVKHAETKVVEVPKEPKPAQIKIPEVSSPRPSTLISQPIPPPPEVRPAQPPLVKATPVQPAEMDVKCIEAKSVKAKISELAPPTQGIAKSDAPSRAAEKSALPPPADEVDLDALLAGLASEKAEQREAAEEATIDPDLAALLADL